MSNKKGLGRNQLEFNKDAMTPKFLQNLKRNTEVDISAKFKEYVEKDDDNLAPDQPDDFEQEAIQKAIEDEKKSEKLFNEKQKEEEEEKRKHIEEERNKRIEEDRIEEEQARLEGRERKILFQKPTASMVTKSKLKDTSQNNLKKTTESVKKTILNNNSNNTTSTKSKIDSIKSNKKKKPESMLSFSMDDGEEEN
ncbi:hypothetical protein DICPUDRAFT_90289 [Dictyostelium purpureum]|uniref:DUF4604 domain-containing protein n=1 Tax=Dictyostelium purpureum TaxID=5786 RepID=F1A1K5_DICPU|nr:uncharacterized protein DICPUDRAFT_90289 [Dictyostelium purpureum]EGC29925.1 hypothetical protein DICPUDRAFT_90289 [Dictyostelium purpureum]|eukprot:XP_003293547.1 hypothetical protein DICPUDRAFT_90289 [Dictyostelium purpureum]